jgi:20S proteasome subunit alpha 4
VLAVEKKTTPKLQDPRSLKKIVQLDEHLFAGFAGLSADARILLGKAKVECQSHRLTIEDAPSVETIARFIAETQQQYTQKGGVRPFGVCCLVVGMDHEGKPRLFLTEPSGLHSEWLACSIGRGSKAVREFLESKLKSQSDADRLTRDEVVRAAVEALLETVQTGAQSMEVAVLSRDDPTNLHFLDVDQIAGLVEQIERERQAEAERRRQVVGSSGGRF